MSSHWYALRSKPHREEVVCGQALIRGIEVFYPRLRTKPVNPRARKVRPYFPGYMFVRADLNEVGLSSFQYLPYAIGLVCFGGEPGHVSDSLIHGIRRRVDEIAELGGESCGGLKRGDQVRIEDGPFAGYEAIFDARLHGSERVRVLLQMLSGQSMPVELSAAQIGRRQRS